MKLDARLGDEGRDFAALGACFTAHLEQITKIGTETNVDAKASVAVGIVAKANPLVADGLPQELGAFECNRIPRERYAIIRVNVGIGEIDRERRIVVLNVRAQEERPHPLEPEFVPGEETGVVEIDSFGARSADANVAVIVENRESVLVFQTPQRTLNEGRLGFDIMLRQFYRRVHDVVDAALGLMHVASDVCAPRDRIQPAARSSGRLRV